MVRRAVVLVTPVDHFNDERDAASSPAVQAAQLAYREKGLPHAHLSPALSSEGTSGGP